MIERTVFVVDDDPDVRSSLRALLESAGYEVIGFPSALAFLSADETRGSCLITDVRMPEMSGLSLQEELARRGSRLPVIIITGHGDVALAIRAMKAGAVDFLEKPLDAELLLQSVARAVEIARQERDSLREAAQANELVSRLTPRELDVLQHLAAGRSNKLVAHELNISPRTVEIHRGRIMSKLRARSLSDLVRTAIAASKRSHPNANGTLH